MNTPRQDNPLKRWSTMLALETTIPPGQYMGSVQDPEFVLRLGTIALRWPHIEEAIVMLFAELVGGDDATLTARQLSVPIFSVHMRLKLMKSMLENGRRNKDKGKEYDMLLQELEAVNKLRNEYIHSVCHTHDSGKIFLNPPNVHMFPVQMAREVTTVELDQYLERLGRVAASLVFIGMKQPPKLPQGPPVHIVEKSP